MSITFLFFRQNNNKTNFCYFAGFRDVTSVISGLLKNKRPPGLMAPLLRSWKSTQKWGVVNQHLESGNRGPKNLESGNWSSKNLESGNWENIWNLGSGGLGRGSWTIFFDRISFLSSYMGKKYPNINLFYKWTHKQRQDGQTPLPYLVHDDITITIMLQNMHAHFRAAIRFQKVFSNGLKLNPM